MDAKAQRGLAEQLDLLIRCLRRMRLEAGTMQEAFRQTMLSLARTLRHMVGVLLTGVDAAPGGPPGAPGPNRQNPENGLDTSGGHAI